MQVKTYPFYLANKPVQPNSALEVCGAMPAVSLCDVSIACLAGSMYGAISCAIQHTLKTECALSGMGELISCHRLEFHKLNAIIYVQASLRNI